MNYKLHITCFFKFLFLLTVVFCLNSCSDEPSAPSVEPAHRTILIYMSANNTLGSQYYCDEADIIEIKQAVREGAIGDNNRLIIFHGAPDNTQTLYEVDDKGNFNTIKVYPGDDFDTSADFMLQVFNDAKNHAPADDYGLILWSHGLGWTQNGLNDNGPTLSPKTWGEDRGRQMNITTLARVLQASPWSWIYFDCCFMGSVEVVYQLAPYTDFIVASPSEIPLDGMPYDKNLALFFKPQADLVGAAKNTFEYYDNQFGSNRTATISVINTSYMRQLADVTIPIYKASTKVYAGDFSNMPLEITATPKFYDMGVYVSGLCQANHLPEEMYAQWLDIYEKAVVYHAGTPKLWNSLDITRFTGLSTYIPASASSTDYRNYQSLKWYEDVAHYLFNKD